MADTSQNLDQWILGELRDLGILPPKLKKIRIQINKKNLKGKSVGTFGVALSKLLSCSPSTTQVPPFLEKIAEFLSNHVSHNCIFRKNGNTDRMRHLQARLELGQELADECIEDVAGIMKFWFRDLPVPLIPEEFHDMFICCHKVCEKSSSSKALLLGCSLLPPEHLTTLKFILEFLASVAKHSAVNRMSPLSLAIVFAPNIMPVLGKQCFDKSINIETLKEKQDLALKVVQWLIEHWEEVKKTPESVEFLAHLAAQSNNKSNRKKTKRRKSVCDIVGVKIKKMVAPFAEASQVDHGNENPTRKHKAECKAVHVEVPFKKSKNNTSCVENSTEKENSGISSGRLIGVSPRIAPSQARKSVKLKKGIAKTRSNSLSYNKAAQKIQQPTEMKADVDDNKPIAESSTLCQEDIILNDNQNTNQMLVNAATTNSTPTKDGNGELDRPRSTLKRGRPNTVTSGLKDRRQANLRGSTSLENLVLPFEKLEVSRRKSRSASSVYDKGNDEDFSGISVLPECAASSRNLMESNENLTSFDVSKESDIGKPFGDSGKQFDDSDSSVSVNRVLDFFKLDPDSISISSDSNEKVNVSPVASRIENLFCTSLGFSPILSFDKDVEVNDPNQQQSRNQTVASNVSRNPFDDITNDSEIPTLNSSVGDRSLFGTSERQTVESSFDITHENSTNENKFCTPSPIVKKQNLQNKMKLSITACSTPANDLAKVTWHGAASYDFNQSLENNVDGPKRESIIKLKETNAGKVLANINLYNKVCQDVARSRSPAQLRRQVFERNSLATKSVRERKKPFLESHGFKVPSTCPSSIRRLKITKSSPISESTGSPNLNDVKENESDVKNSSFQLSDAKCTSDLVFNLTDSDHEGQTEKIPLHLQMLI